MMNFKVCLIGDGNVGKTTLVKRLTQGDFVQEYIPTLGCDVTPLKYNNVCFNIWDCSGNENRGLGDGYFVQSHAAIIMFDLTSINSFRNVKKWITSFTRVNGPVPIVICGTKCDLVRKVSNEDIRALLNNCKRAKYFDISSKTNYNFVNPFNELVKSLLI